MTIQSIISFSCLNSVLDKVNLVNSSAHSPNKALAIKTLRIAIKAIAMFAVAFVALSPVIFFGTPLLVAISLAVIFSLSITTAFLAHQDDNTSAARALEYGRGALPLFGLGR